MDYITSVEPSGSSSVGKTKEKEKENTPPSQPQDFTDKEKENEKGKVAKRRKPDDSLSFPNLEDSFGGQKYNTKISGGTRSSDSWKERYFKSIANTEESMCHINKITSNLKSYYLLLQSIKLEKELGMF